MRRTLAVLLIACVGFYTGAWLRNAWAAVPTGCTWPSAPDNFAAVAPGDHLNTTLFNRMLCALNAIEAKIDAGAKGAENRCVGVSVNAGARVLVDVSMTKSLMGSEAVFASAIDSTNPSRLVADGIQTRVGNLVQAWIWNRDADGVRSGFLCVEAYSL